MNKGDVLEKDLIIVIVYVQQFPYTFRSKMAYDTSYKILVNFFSHETTQQ